jgi:hypothetical protein
MVLNGHGVELLQGGEDGVDVGHAPFVRDGRGGQTYQIHFEARWGAERSDCGGRFVRVRNAPIATKFRGAAK